ncbi:MAG: orotidine-5'-phosphate decarboxylase [Phycisphaerae bacterium]|nr:orotidine-5'-phosphate decarboxylase [Phycisphaerae bacterium]
MPQNFADRLLKAVTDRCAPAAVAVDPVYANLPAEIVDHRDLNDESDAEAALDAVLEFCRRVIRIVAPLVPAVKINSAYFERYYAEGIEGYYELVQEASARDLVVIGDVKRGDVGHTAEMYAHAHLADSGFVNLEDQVAPDAVTVNGYFGLDGVMPFINVACEQGKGVFVLVRTSNESASAIQDIVAQDGRKVHEIVAGQVAEWASNPRTIGESGYSSIGAVVATRDPADAARLRAAMPRSIFLVPGYGAQGGTAEDFLPYFRPDGTGAIVVAGRSVIYAHRQPKYKERFASQWEKCIEQSCKDFVAALTRATQSNAGA